MQASLLALLSALAGSAAHAEVRASAQLTNFGWSLIDLDPDDGIAPALTIDAAHSRADLLAQALAVPLDSQGRPLPDFEIDIDYPQRRRAFLPALQARAALPQSSALAQTGGDFAALGFSATASGRTDGTRNDLVNRVFQSVASPAYWDGLPGSASLLLTPRTRLEWSGDVSLAVSHTRYPWAGRAENALALIGATLVDAGSDETIDSYGRSVFVQPRSEQARSFQGRLLLAWDNAGSAPAAARLVLNLSATGQSERLLAPPPVPEPGTWALLGCGLGVVAVAGRRRARKGRHAPARRGASRFLPR